LESGDARQYSARRDRVRVAKADHVDGKIQQAALLDETHLERGLRGNDCRRRHEACATRHCRDRMSPAHQPIACFRRQS
jgi:hypothetical protein